MCKTASKRKMYQFFENKNQKPKFWQKKQFLRKTTILESFTENFEKEDETKAFCVDFASSSNWQISFKINL